VASAGTVCRSAAGECDLAETCSGVAGQPCPSDAKRAAGTACTDDGSPCTLDQCDGCNAACQHPAGNAGAVCRVAAGACDVAETCNGTNGTCPADGFASSSTGCTGSSQGGACDDDPADRCSGTANTCVDAFKASTVTCRAAAGDCDVAESCTGSSGAC